MKTKKTDITQEQLMNLFDYDEASGRLFRRRFSNGLFTGLELAGTDCGDGYRYVDILGRSYLEHRVIWARSTGFWPAEQLDHINKNRSDNRIINLREVNNSTNQKNTKLRKTNKSGIMGVHARTDNGRWSVRISHSGKRYALGSFSDFFEACCVRKAAEARFGYHSGHGAS